MTVNRELKKDIDKTYKDDIQLEVISRKNKRRGLCKDCIRAETCSLSHNTDDVIYDCDDYENGSNDLGSTNKDFISSEVKADKSKSANTGLCAYCIHRKTCSLLSVDGGIWHCSEYA